MSKYSRKFKRALALVLTFVMAVSVITVTPSTNVEAASNKVVKSLAGVPAAKTMNVGETTSFKANVRTTKKVAKNLLQVTVKSSDSSVVAAKVAAKPKNKKKAKKGASVINLTAGKAGTATITVTTKAKNKKNKKVTKKMVVTVNAPAPAPTTQPTTIATTTQAPNNNNNNTNEKPAAVLKEISVSADVTSITEKGGQAKLSVKSASEGAEIVSVTYKSSNTQVATVDEDGVVTGVNYNPAPVTITVTATDKNGNVATNTIAITVTQLKTAKITLSEEDKTASLYVGETKTLKPTVTDAEEGYVIDWTSSKESVATVKDGIITAVSKGQAIITGVVKGTNASVSCTVTVSDEAPGIEKFEASHAGTLKVTFSAPFSKADQENLNIDLKIGSDKAPAFETEWAADGKSVELVKKSDYEVATYTVTISGEKVAYNTNKAEATYKVEPCTIASIDIPTDYVPAYVYAKILFEAKDQYGDVMQNVTADQFTWQITSERASTDTQNSVYTGRLNRTGNIYANLDPADTKLVADQDDITVFAYLTSNSKIRVTKNIGVKNLAVQNIKITGTKEDKVYQNSKEFNVELTYEATDNLGGAVDLEAYYNGAYTSKITTTTSKEDICEAPVITKEGTILVKVPANAVGKATVTVMAKDNKLSEYEIEILAAPYAKEVVFPAENTVSVVAGEVAKIPVTFKNQYGDAMGVGSVTPAAFADCFGTIGVNGFKGELSSDDVTYENGANEDYLLVDTSNVTNKGTATLTARSTDEDPITTTFGLEVTAPRGANKIKITKAPKETILVGQTTTVEFEIQDAYGKAWTDDTTYIMEVTGATLQDDASTDYIVVSRPVINADGTGYATVKGKAATSKASAQQIQLNLKKLDGKYITNEPVKYAFTVNNNIAENDKGIVATLDKASYKAGTKAVLTLTAQYDGSALNTYNESYEAVAIYDSVSGKAVNYPVKFENGVAKVEIETSKAGDKVVYYGQIESDGNGYATTFKTGEVKIEPNDPVAFNISVENTDVTVSYVDVKGNTVDIDKTNVSQAIAKISVSSKTGKDVTAKYVSVDGASQIVVSFNKGVASFGLLGKIPEGYTLTFTYGGFTATYIAE